MRAMSAVAQSVSLSSHTVSMRVESWLGGQLLADDIPVSDGTETLDATLAIPEQASLTVPRQERGTLWTPLDDGDPLAARGQQLRISYGVDVGGGQMEWIQRGWFLITDTQTDGPTVTVQAAGLLSLIDEAKLASTFQPAGGLKASVRALVEPALTVQFDAALTDRGVPSGISWDTDRMGALAAIMTAWPAQYEVTPDGYLLVEPVGDPTGDPVMSITDGAGGTVVRWQGDSTRDSAFNMVIASGQQADGTQIQGVAYDTDSASAFRIGGPFNPLPVPYSYDSPLLTTVAQCRAAAASQLIRLRQASSRTLSAVIVPHPGLVTGDLVSVTGETFTDLLCVVQQVNLPYSPNEETLLLRVVGG
jgi:hypothetical protein